MTSAAAPPRTRRWWLVTVPLGCVGVGLGVIALARFAPFQMPFPISAAESEAFWALLPAYALALACLHEKRRRFASGFALIALVHAGWTVEWLPHARAAGTGTG